MPTFKRCDSSVPEMAQEIMEQFATYEPLLACKARVDFVFAYADRDNGGNPRNDALTLHSVKALGIARKLGLKDRAMGRGDAEISLDGDWWEEASDAERRSLLDHELHHLVFMGKMDDLGRPVLGIRPHDFDMGWFKVISARHGAASQERQQAAKLMESSGQYFWPEIRTAVADGSRIANLELHVNRK